MEKCVKWKMNNGKWKVLQCQLRVVGDGVLDVPCTGRKFGGAPAERTHHCRGGDSRARRCTGSWYKVPIK